MPVFDDHRTTYLSKYAYGAPVVEIVFGKQELMSLCQDAGLRLEREWPGIPYDVLRGDRPSFRHGDLSVRALTDARVDQSGAITVRT